MTGAYAKGRGLRKGRIQSRGSGPGGEGRGRNWVGRAGSEGDRERKEGAGLGGVGADPEGRETCPNPVFPISLPSRWRHRWQNINYYFLGKRKRHLVPLLP